MSTKTSAGLQDSGTKAESDAENTEADLDPDDARDLATRLVVAANAAEGNLGGGDA